MLCMCYITLNFSETLSSASGQISRALLVAVGSGTIQVESEIQKEESIFFLFFRLIEFTSSLPVTLMFKEINAHLFHPLH